MRYVSKHNKELVYTTETIGSFKYLTIEYKGKQVRQSRPLKRLKDPIKDIEEFIAIYLPTMDNAFAGLDYCHSYAYELRSRICDVFDKHER